LALLAQIGVVPDTILPPEIDETPLKAENPRLYAQRMARAKAAANARDGAFVLAADTVVAAGRRILPKAETREQAAKCLDLLSGRRFTVFTAVVLTAPDGRTAERVSETAIALARLSDLQKKTYLDSLEWQGRAGGHNIEGRIAAHVRLLIGSHSGVVGLPLFETASLLRGLGYPFP
jgi:septum formation protein